MREGLVAKFEPTMPITDRQKQPDVKLLSESANEHAFLEVSIQETAKHEKEASESHYVVTKQLISIRPGIMWAGKISRTLAPPHLKDVLKRMDRAVGSIGDAWSKSFCVMKNISSC